MEVGIKLNHPGAIYNINWSNDGSYLASVSLFGSIRIWKTDDFSLVQDIRDKEVKRVFKVAITTLGAQYRSVLQCNMVT